MGFTCVLVDYIIVLIYDNNGIRVWACVRDLFVCILEYHPAIYNIKQLQICLEFS